MMKKMKIDCNRKDPKFNQQTPLCISWTRTYNHDRRGEIDPADVPELVGSDAHHLVDAVAEFVGAEDPGDGDRLEEATP
jgi:hypothetical protein